MKKSSFVSLLLVGATILGATVLRERIASAAQTVSATIIGPLDANGNVTVHEQGTAAVHEQGTANVQVANPSVPIEQAGTPVTIQFPTGPYTVPDGKRLVIEYLNSETLEDSVAVLSLEHGRNEFHFRFSGEGPAVLCTSGQGFCRWVSEPVKIYANPGTQVDGNNSTSLFFTISGYLVDV
jgi:hypothetical protein